MFQFIDLNNFIVVIKSRGLSIRVESLGARSRCSTGPAQGVIRVEAIVDDKNRKKPRGT